MADYLTQQYRFISIATTLGPDKLLLRAFNGTEVVSELFSFQLELLSEDHHIDINRILGERVTISLNLPELQGGQRHFNGFISRVRQLPNYSKFAHYQAEMVPWLWLLTRSADCRIFQKETVPDIIEKIFREFGFQDFERELKQNYKPWEYCVQYRESACNFIMRLMEAEGIYFFFRHEKDRHVLVMADSPSGHKPLEPLRIKFENVVDSGYLQEDNRIKSWLIDHDLRSGRYALKDYNFETPSSSLLANIDSSIHVGNNQIYEIYDYPGKYEKRDEGDQYVRTRMEAEEVEHATIQGEGNCRHFDPGFRFELTDHFRQDQNQGYVLTSVIHDASIGGNFPDTTTADDHHYSNRFTCIPSSVPFRPSRQTPKPIVKGSQTAVVVGPSGEEIHTDKYGRVKVQFYWDRYGEMNENSSFWVRVSQNWAGNRWGAFFLPRIGQEVIVDFLEGDPDRPIITGRVYNAEQMPPYELPAEMTKSTIKSYSSKGGEGFNELRFEDKKGKEQVFIHAERNQDNRVKNDSMEWVGKDRHLIVTGDQFEEVKGDKHLSVQGDQNEKINGTVSQDVAMDIQQKAGMKHALEAGMEIHLKAGVNLVMEAGASLTLKVGGNFINLNPAGVFIQGTMVMVNSGGSAGTGSGSSPAAPKMPLEADKAKPGAMAAPSPPDVKQPVAGSQPPSPQAVTLKQAAESGTPFCEKCEAARRAQTAGTV